jgi:putative oxidoreductase
MSHAALESVALLILRVFVGVAFVLHGYGKVRKTRPFAARFGLPLAIAVLVANIQLIGGLMLIAGIFTPAAAFAIAVTMVGAVAKCMGRGERFIDPEHHSWESAAFYLVTTVVLALLGPGAYSIDHVLFG